MTNWTGPLGWSLLAAISGSVSGLFGVAWVLYCDNLYFEKESQPANS